MPEILSKYVNEHVENEKMRFNMLFLKYLRGNRHVEFKK